VIFVPSPNVAADHQTKNAEEFVQQEAAFMIKDSELSSDLKAVISSLIFDELKLEQFRTNIKKFARPEAADEVASGIKELAESNLISGKN
jgi:UDP-N-acetylglucosamine--N-acetylmuramyl-(pentapeptide) pyrophosphoryl-undecaprenol N-acetylglucosamine transferase